MPVSETICRSVAPEVPVGLARDVLERTGVPVAFFLPGGARLSVAAAGAEADGPRAAEAPVDEVVARLVREAAETNQDRSASAPGRVVSAWPIRLRRRAVLVAAGEVPVSNETENGLGRRLLAAVADTVRARFEEAAALSQRDSVSTALTQSFEEISLLHNLGKVLRVTRPATALLEYVCSELRETTGARAAAAYLPGAEGGEAEIVVSGQLPLLESDLPRLVEHLLDGLGPQQCVLVDNHCQDDPALAVLSMALERLVLVPLPLGAGSRGVLAAFNRQGEEFGSPEAKLIQSSASASAIFIENRRLYRELREMMLDLVRALVSSVDAKDPYTCGHSSRVAITCREITRLLGLGEAEAEEAYMAGLLHDIGKIGTPETILRKEGRLLPDERKIIEQHPEVGGRILGGIRKLDAVREAVVHHHERTDGRGYPDGLAGDETPLLARIVGLADAFDAMTSNRPYRPVMPLDHVLREIEQNTGTQFDPQVAAAFFRLNLSRLMRLFVDRPTTGCPTAR